MSWLNEKYPRGTKTIGFKNVARDFEQDFVFKGRTKNGRMKLGKISGWSPEGLTVCRNRLTKYEDRPDGIRRHTVFEGGSCFNTYYYDEKTPKTKKKR